MKAVSSNLQNVCLRVTGFRGRHANDFDDASIPKANIHYYFSSKEKLYRRVVERIFTVWLEAADSFNL